ncbi:MAG: hypothetical protein U1F66_10280 [bacterium]
MTPPKIPNQDLSFLDWAPGQEAPPAGPADPNNCSNCHSAPKPASPYSVKSGNPFFLDYAPKPKQPMSAQDKALLRAWIAGDKVDPANAATDNPPPPAAKPAPVKPVAPGDAAKLEDHAKELERQARLTLDPEKKLAFYQSALAFHLLSGDAKASSAVLDQLEAGYQKSKQEAGQKFVAATRLWVAGKTDEALQALAEMEKAAQGAGWAFYQQYSAQRSLLLQGVAGEMLRKKDYAGAKPLLFEALRLTPSEQLTAQVLKLMAEHGEADLNKQAADLAALQAQRDQLATPPVRCNTNCHSANDRPNFNDFTDYAPLLSDPGGKAFFKGPDLSAYRTLTHLSYQQKLQLHDLDEKLSAARKKYSACTEEIRNLLFLKTLDDPKRELADIEASYLKGAKAFSAPDRALPWALAGEAYLAKPDYAKAVAALEAAAKEDPTQVNLQFSLGKARFATGDFQGSRDAYTAILAQQPQDVIALQFRADANSQYLSSLDPKTQANEIAKVQGELASDRAMLLARYSANEKDKLAKLGESLVKLREGGEASLEARQETLELMEGMAKQYLALAETPQAGVKEVELVRKELNALAAQTFDLLAKFAKTDSDPAIQKRAGLYEGYSHLAKGEIDEATKAFEPLRKDFPEIDKILGVLEKNKLRMVNLAALDAWAVYNKEGAAVQADAQSGLLGSAIGGLESLGRKDGKDFRDDTKERWKGQVAFVAELRSRIESGKADTILQAMEQIEKDGPESMKKDARSYIDYEDRAFTGYPLGALVHLVDKLPPEPGEAEELLHKTWDLERQNPAIETPYAFYTLVNFFDKDVSWNGTAREHMDALEGKGTFGQSAFKFITSMSPESLAFDVLLMVGSAGLGNLAKLAALSKLEKAGVTGYKAIVLAGAAGVGVEATALWAGNLGKEAMLKDPSKVFTQDHMLKSYGATLIMIGGLKGAGALGESLAPRAAKSLGLLTEGGSKLTTGGKVLSWGIGHGTGLGGMIATSHINQAAGLTPRPIGGWKEGLVHDVFGYVQFAIAHKMADGIFGGKLSAISQRQHSEIAVREAILSAKSYADTLGFRATRGPKGEIIDSPERKLIVGLLVDASLNKVGFSGGKLAKLVESRQYDKANDYLAEFGLPLEYNKAGQVNAVARGELSPHAAAGIPAGKPKPAPKRVVPDPYLEQFAAKVAELMDKAAEWLFGPPGGGGFGFGGLEPALAGAHGMVTPKGGKPAPEPAKGPPIAFMSGKGKGEGGGKGKTLNPFAENTANDNDNYEVVPYTTKPGEGLDAILNTLKDHFSDPTKIIVIKATRPLDSQKVIAEKIGYYDPKARIEVHLPDGTKVEVGAKLGMDQVHEDVLVSGSDCYWEAGKGSPRGLFELQGKNGAVPLSLPAGVKKIEIHTENPVAVEDLAFLMEQADRLGVEVVLSGARPMSFKNVANGLEIQAPKGLSPEELDQFVQSGVSLGQDLSIGVGKGQITVKKGSSAKDSELTTQDPDTALLAPERVILSLAKAPSGAELQALQAKGIKRVRFSDDPKSPDFALRALDAMKQSKGMNVRVLDPSGKMLWENTSKAEGDTLRSQSELFKAALLDHAAKQGWTDRLGEMKKLLGAEAARLDFAQATLRASAALDLAAASVPPGGKDPAISAEQFETWLQRGQELASFKHNKAVEKGNADLARELSPFAEGFKTDPAATDGWSQAVGKVRDFLAKHGDNPALLAKVFGHLNKDTVGSDAFENNAYDLARFLVETDSPYRRLRELDDVYSKSTASLQIRGALFGSFLKGDNLGAKKEVESLSKAIEYGRGLNAKGYDVAIESIPTSKALEGVTPDLAITVNKGGQSWRFLIEVKKISRETVAKGTKESFGEDLEKTFQNSGKKSDDSSLGTQIGKGLSQLNRYGTKVGTGNLVLDVHLDAPPPPYFREILKKFLEANCPNIAVRIQYNELQPYASSGAGRTEMKTVSVESVIRADSAKKYQNYDSNPDYFAPLYDQVVAAE